MLWAALWWSLSNFNVFYNNAARYFSNTTPSCTGVPAFSLPAMHSPTKFAAFCTEVSSVSPRTASAARMEAKMSPVPGREAPAMGVATVV